MNLQPHLHLLVPSSSSNIHLEVRLYLPPALFDNFPPWTQGLSSTAASNPVTWESLDKAVKDKVNGGLGEDGRVVVASHPWGRFGGNMLFPVIAHHLVSSAMTPSEDIVQPPPPSYTTDGKTGNGKSAMTSTSTGALAVTDTAVLTFNIRGIGASQGRQPILGAGEDDFAAVERWGVEVLGVRNVWRFGYSWGCISANHAPIPPAPTIIQSVMLISPAISPLKLLFWYRKFFSSILAHLTYQPKPLNPTEDPSISPAYSKVDPRERVWMIYGTKDDFTKDEVFRVFIKDTREQEGGKGLRVIDVPDATHFWGGEEAADLRAGLTEWLYGK